MDDEQKKKEIETNGHEASADELGALEPIGNKDDAEGEGPAEEELPEETDGVAEGNEFSDTNE